MTYRVAFLGASDWETAAEDDALGSDESVTAAMTIWATSYLASLRDR